MHNYKLQKKCNLNNLIFSIFDLVLLCDIELMWFDINSLYLLYII